MDGNGPAEVSAPRTGLACKKSMKPQVVPVDFSELALLLSVWLKGNILGEPALGITVNTLFSCYEL